MPGLARFFVRCDRQLPRRRQFAERSRAQTTDRQTVSTLAYLITALGVIRAVLIACYEPTLPVYQATMICVGAPFGLPYDLGRPGLDSSHVSLASSRSNDTRSLFLLTVSGFPTALESSRRARKDSPQFALGWKAFDNGCMSRLFSQLAASFQG